MPTTTRQPDPRSFDRLPAVFDGFAQLVGGPLDDYLTGHLPTHGERAVDLGCGTGSHAWQLSRVFDNVLAVDISAPMLAHARRHRPAGTIHYQRRDLTDVTPGRDGRFDFVLFTHTLHHVPDLRFALELIRSLVKPGGQVVLIDNVDPRRQAPRSWFRSEARKPCCSTCGTVGGPSATPWSCTGCPPMPPGSTTCRPTSSSPRHSSKPSTARFFPGATFTPFYRTLAVHWQEPAAAEAGS